MPSDDFRNLLDERHETMMRRLDEIHDDVRKQNGRVRTLENKMAVLSWAYGLGASVIGYVSYRVFGR